MRLLRLLVLALALAGTTVSNVRAQTVGSVTVTPSFQDWENRPSTPDYTSLNNKINRTDCLADDASISFSVSFTNATSNMRLEVWSGQMCDVQMNREENTNCVMVFTGEAENETVSVSVQDLLQKGADGQGVGTGTQETCDDAGGGEAGTERTLYFLAIDPSAEAMPAGQGLWPFTFDTSQPNPPTNVMAGPGEESIVITFDASEDDDLAKYRVYCADDEGGCSSSTLKAGEDVPATTSACGSTNSTLADEIIAQDLMNGVSYAVGVTSEDDFGNRSKLSPLSCAVPQEVTGFYEAYRAAGGQGGGGFCSFAPPGRGSVALFGLALVGAALLRRRR